MTRDQQNDRQSTEPSMGLIPGNYPASDETVESFVAKLRKSGSVAFSPFDRCPTTSSTLLVVTLVSSSTVDQEIFTLRNHCRASSL